MPSFIEGDTYTVSYKGETYENVPVSFKSVHGLGDILYLGNIGSLILRSDMGVAGFEADDGA